MEPEDSSFNKVGKQICSFIDREMSVTLVFWLALFFDRCYPENNWVHPLINGDECIFRTH